MRYWKLEVQGKYLNLKMMKTKKNFDSVKMMREIRDKHSKEYESNPELREQRLAAIRKKYANKIKKSEFISH
jgi:hypothetical protein